MELNLDDWVTNSNECFDINLYRSTNKNGPERLFDAFHPSYTYTVIEENETIAGYKNPSIQLDFRANDMKPQLKISFDQQLDLKKISPDLNQIDLSPELFREYLPETINEAAAPAPAEWKPPGERQSSFSLHGKQYEIWKASMTDPEARRIWINMRLLNVSPYTLAGFSTSYRAWIFPTFEIARATKQLPSPAASVDGDGEKYTPPRLSQDPETFLFTDKLDLLQTPSRERISQFLVLPPYQGRLLGTRLYDHVFQDLATKPFIYEIPVEDPSEAFDAMRDYGDITYLRALLAFQKLSIASNIPPESLRKDSPIPRDQILGNGIDLEQLRKETKIVSRQFYRMVELHLLSTIPPNNRSRSRITRKAKSSNENDRRYYFWRLALKHRIYSQNADALDQMEDSAERVEKLESAVDSQQEEFEERLEGLEKRLSLAADDAAVPSARTKRKRAVAPGIVKAKLVRSSTKFANQILQHKDPTMANRQFNIAVLISGNGSNLQALIDACASGALPNTRITHVISNRKAAYGLERAAKASIPTTYHNLVPYKKQHPSDIDLARQQYDADLAKIILESTPRPDLIVCAGWMHIVTPAFLTPIAAAGIKIINLHPALPGEFAGAGAIERAWKAGQEDGLKRTGVMIHEVIAEVDAGDAVVTQEVELREGEALEALEERIHEVEHGLIVEGTRRVLGRIGGL
ncbi:Formyl-trans-N multi-domain protein [Pyrenophora tritici-repentis]|nr:Formyl-trans-N multi-domain protein [Pyrenophora tritici-repentis]